MKPVYFPYTYLSPSVAHSLRALFSSVAVYQPVADRLPDEMRPLAKEGFLDVMAPPQGGEEDFDALMRDFRQWASLHQKGVGLKAAILHGHLFSGPMSGDGCPADIVSEIQRRLTPGPASKQSETTLTARVFLDLAQASDQLDHQIGRELERYEKAQARLFNALKGQPGPVRSGSDPWIRADLEDNGEDHLDLRMAAWARLFSSLPYPSPVFVTHSQAVIRYLAETVPGRLRIRVGGLSPALQNLACEKQLPTRDLMPQLVVLADAPLSWSGLQSDDTDEKPVGKCNKEPCVHLWPQVPPRRFFSLALGKGPAESGLPPPQFPWRNTLVIQVR